MLFRRKRFQQNGLRDGLQTAAADALKNSGADDYRQRKSGSTQNRTGGEEDQRKYEIAFSSKNAGQPAADRYDDSI